MATVTVQHVAKAAGVSRSTANKVLLGELSLFRESTAKKVLDAAESLGYKPNMLARGLRQQRTYLLATMVSSVNAAYAYELSAGIQNVAAEHSCAPVTFSCSDEKNEFESLNICVDRQVDALLINNAPRTSNSENRKRILELAAAGLPMIEVFGQNLPGIPSIIVDYEFAGYESTRRLIAMGLKEILFWSPFHVEGKAESTPGTWFAFDMYRGYLTAMREAGLLPKIEVFDVDLLDKVWAPRCLPPEFVALSREMLVNHPGLQAIVTPGETPANAISQVIQSEPGLVAHGFAQASMDLSHMPLGVTEKRILIRIPARNVGASAAQMAFLKLRGETAQDQLIRPEIY